MLGLHAFATPPAIAALGLVPFNAQNIGNNIYVTCALPGRAAQIACAEGNGAVAVFDASGNLVQTLIAGSKLASPWGIALAPAGWGQFSGDLLVGNFSFVASEINAFSGTGAFLGTIPIDDGGHPGGLWDLIFGNAGNNGTPDTLFFADGINGEAVGLFGHKRSGTVQSGFAWSGACAPGIRCAKSCGERPKAPECCRKRRFYREPSVAAGPGIGGAERFIHARSCNFWAH